MKKLTILMPCLNEAQTIGQCIARARRLLDEHDLDGEILISDNGSRDGSQQIAADLGARVVHCPLRGYGAALQHGIENAAGEYILMGDADDSYHFEEAYPLVQKLDVGFDVCMGTRLKGRIMPGAMPRLNRFLGNPLLTLVGKLLFAIDTSDFHCGMRAFRRESVLSLGLVTTGMEWASEMVIKARLRDLRMTEVPVVLYKDGRDRPPHLRKWRDGWRHLRFMLIHAPTWLFVVPGLTLSFLALLLGGLLTAQAVQVGRATLDIHSLLAASFMLIVGLQATFTGLFTNLFGHLVGVLPPNPRYERLFRALTLERLLVVAVVVGAGGLALLVRASWPWVTSGFPPLNAQTTMRQLIPAFSMLAIALQTGFNGFMMSTLFLATTRHAVRGPGEGNSA